MSASTAYVCASLVLAGFVSGCSAPVVDEEDIADASEGITQAIVLVERVAADGATQTNVSAKFMRVAATADRDLAERVVGARLELPAIGQCMALTPGSDEAATNSLAALGPIQLLDAGDVAIRTITTGAPSGALRNVVMPLDPRAFPDVGDLVSGVFYTSRDAASDLPAPAKYVLESSGSLDIERLSIEADAPPAPEDVLVGSHTLAQGVTLDAGAPAAIRWRASSEAPAAGRALVYVDVSSSASGATVRCTFLDDGEATLPGSLVGTETLGPIPATGTIAVHRVREATFGPAANGAGIDLGEVRFDLSVIGRARLGAVSGPERTP